MRLQQRQGQIEPMTVDEEKGFRKHGGNMDIIIYPIKRLLMEKEKIENGTHFAAILCSSSELKESKFDWVENKLILCFHDICDANRPNAFTIEMANRVRSFIDAQSGASVLYCCCDSGESRSAAVAAAACRYLHKDELDIWKNPHFHPNGLVFQLQCKAFDVPITKIQRLRREYMSRKAFRNAVKAGYQ